MRCHKRPIAGFCLFCICMKQSLFIPLERMSFVSVVDSFEEPGLKYLQYEGRSAPNGTYREDLVRASTGMC